MHGVALRLIPSSQCFSADKPRRRERASARARPYGAAMQAWRVAMQANYHSSLTKSRILHMRQRHLNSSGAFRGGQKKRKNKSSHQHRKTDRNSRGRRTGRLSCLLASRVRWQAVMTEGEAMLGVRE